MKNIAGVDLNLMTAFEAMMLDGNVTRAGARIGLAQPSMSNALTRLRADACWYAPDGKGARDCSARYFGAGGAAQRDQ
jgi:Bacterial regulatory helix-turn-helix protein, lysR family